MNKSNHQPVYGPDEWDIDFSFDLDMSLSDYLLIGCYLIFVVPVSFLIKAVETVYSWFAGLFSKEQDKAEPARANYGLFSMISKIF